MENQPTGRLKIFNLNFHVILTCNIYTAQETQRGVLQEFLGHHQDLAFLP